MVAVAVTLTPLGIPVLIEAETSALAEAAAAVCDGWSVAAVHGPPVAPGRREVRDLVRARGRSHDPDRPRCMSIRGEEVTATADATSGVAHCRVARSLAASPERLGRDVLEPILLFLLTRRGRTPIHAAGLVIGGRTVILMGPSGAGKSCLALAAAALGLPLLSDDTVFIERGPPLTVWAQRRAIHVFGDDLRGASAGPERLRNGKLKREVAVATPVGFSRHPVALCLLARGSQASLTPIDRAEALAGLPPLEPGFDLLEEDSAVAFALLTESGAWRLTLSADPAEAVALLRTRFEDAP